MMIPIGPGLAPDVSFVGDHIYLAYGAEETAWLFVFAFDGTRKRQQSLQGGFLNSFPRLDGALCGYKTIEGFVPKLIDVDTLQVRAFTSPSDGNWPLFVDSGQLYWQTSNAYHVWRGGFNGEPFDMGQSGAPDGIERLDWERVICRKDIRDEAPTVGGFPSYAGDLTVGQYGYGIGLRLFGDVDDEDNQRVHWIAGDPTDDHPDPRCATNGTLYAVTCWGRQGVRIWILTRDEILALPLTPPDVPIPPGPPDPIPPRPPDPDPPKPDPPKPPKPAYSTIKGVHMLPKEQGWLIGPGDHVLSCDAQGHVSYTKTALEDADLLQLDPVDGDYRGTFRPVAFPDIYLSGDATEFTPGGDVCRQFYGAKAADVLGPDGKPGWYQRWNVGVWQNGIVTALVPYDEQGADNGRKWASASLTWVRKA